MADGDVKDYAGEKKKPSIALVISVGPKMPKKPEDTSTPDEPMKKAWEVMVEDNGTYEISKTYGQQPPQEEQEKREQIRRRNAYQNPQVPVTMRPIQADARVPREGRPDEMMNPEIYQQQQQQNLMNPMNKAFDILKIRSAAPPRKPGAFRRRMPPAPEPEPEPEPEPMEEAPDPEMEMRAKQSVIDAINRIRRKRDKFDESKEVVPTSIEEQEGEVEDLPFSHFLKPPEER